MMDRHHGNWTDQLSDYVNGDLDPEAARDLDEHLAGCPACREVLADIRDVVARAGAWGDVHPPRDLWPDIAGALGPATARREGVEAEVIPLPGTAGRHRRRGLFLTLPQAAAAVVAWLAISAGAMWWAGASHFPSSRAAGDGDAVVTAASMTSPAAVPEALALEVAGLEAVWRDTRDHLDPETAHILEKNLRVIERAIDESVQALELDPANRFVRDHLEQAYRAKAGFLREAAAMVAWEG